MKYLHIFLAFFLTTAGLFTTTACTPAPTYQKLTGETMGTSYHITFKTPKELDLSALQAQIDARLQDINQSMSTYDDTATIMAFNRADANTPITIDADFVQVLKDSYTIYQQSGGAFDPTVKPLVDLWGFGKNLTIERLNSPPSEQEINAIGNQIGLDKVQLTGNTLVKTQNGVALDFSAIAKGYGVDAIAQTLHHNGINHYMVEIGGEVATLGVNPSGKAWQIAIDTPTDGSTAQNRTIATTLTLHNAHLATSGNYRNQLEWQGTRYSHTINPHTAHPVANGIPSVSVIHDSTALADGWATALTAIPQEQAIQLATTANIKALFIIKNPNTKDNTHDDWQLIKSPALKAYETTHPAP